MNLFIFLWLVATLISSQTRIKIFLYVLLQDIEFSMDPTIEIEKKIKCVSFRS